MRKAILRSIALVLFCITGGSYAFGQLSGAYTINASAAASATNYQSFSAAASDLNSGTRTDGGPTQGPGVNGAVTFTVAAGTYNEQVVLNPITGTSATNTVTFDGVSNATRKITQASTALGSATVMVNGADYVTFKNLEIENTGTTYGFGVQLVSGATNCEISDCKISLPANATSYYKVGIIVGTYYTSYGYFAQDLLLENNEINGGRFGVIVNGQSTSMAQGIEVRDNVFRDFYYCGFYTNYSHQLQFTGNDIEAGTAYVSAYGAQIRYGNEFNISENIIRRVGAYGLYIYYANGTSFNTATVINNMIGGDFRTSGTCYALYLSTCRNVNIWHNSVHAHTAGGNGGRALYIVGSSTGNVIQNNSFATSSNSGGTTPLAYYISSGSYLTAMDNNNYYSDGTYLGYLQGYHANLAALQSSFSLWNINSREQWPNYLGTSDLHTFGPPLNNWAANITSITSDIDGDSRPWAPDTIKDVGADEILLAPFDMDLMNIVSPTVLATGNNTVSVEVMNGGTNSLNGINTTMQYSTDGGTTWPVSETFTPTGLGTSGNTQVFSFSTPWNVSSAGTYNLCIRINPQVSGDPDNSDQLCLTVCTGMSGNYTIDNGSPTAGTNYNSFNDAVSALATCGIGGPVYFTVAPGTYNEFIDMPAILGTSPTNTITFDGVDRDSVTITYAHTATNSSIIKLDGTDYTTFKNMTVNSTGTYGYGLHLTNTADNDSMVNLAINLPTTSTSVYHIGVVVSGQSYSTYGNNANNFVMMDCDVVGGYYGMRMNGVSSSVYTNNNRVLNNTFTDFYYYGVMCYYQSNLHVDGNFIRQRTGASGGYGIYCYYSDSLFNISNNQVYNVGTRALYLYYGNQSGAQRPRVANNMFGGPWTATTVYAMYIYNTRKVDILHNSINLCTAGGYPMYLGGSSTGTDSVRIINNIFRGTSSYAVYITQPYFVQDIDHNMYQTSSPTPYYFGGLFASLATWRAAYPAFNTGSVQDEPGFVGCGDLHLFCSPADNLGEPLGILTDIDGNPRSTTTPDIGASEFVSQQVSINLGQDTTHCGRYFLEGDTLGFNIHQWSTGQSSWAIYVDSTDTIDVYAIDSNNCRARDTIILTILDRPAVPFGNDTVTICNTTTLDAGSPGSSYNWSTGDTTRTIFTPNPGSYTVDITSQDGCTVTDTITVNWYAVSAVNLGPDQTFCLGGSATLNAGNQPSGSQFLWNTGAVTQVSVVTAPGTYHVQVTTPDGCIGNDTIQVNALLPPVVNLGPDTTLCNPLLLNAGNPGSTYQWSTGSTAQQLTVNQSGSYTVTVTNAAGCDMVDNINVVISNGPTVSLGPDPILCDGQTVTLNAGNSGSSYLWSTGSINQTITTGNAGTYIVVVTDPQTGCTGSDTININQSFLSVNLGNDQYLCNGQPAFLDAGSGATGYLWSTGATSQTINVSNPGTYSVVVSDAAGCNASDTVVVNAGTSIAAAFNAPANTPLWQTVQFTDNSTGGAISWFWDFGDGTTSTLQNPSHAFVSMGNFNVCLTVNDGICDNTVCQTVQVQAPIGIEDEMFAAGVTVFPNPNDGRFQIGFELQDYESVDVEIYSVSGQTVYKKYLANVLNHREAIDLTARPAGIYILRMVTDSGKQMTRKLVIE